MKQTKLKLELPTILGDWAMCLLDGPGSIGRAGPQAYPCKGSGGAGNEVAIANYWSVEDAIEKLHTPRYAGMGQTMRCHIKAEFEKARPLYGRFHPQSLESEYWGHLTRVILELAEVKYKGIWLG